MMQALIFVAGLVALVGGAELLVRAPKDGYTLLSC